MSDLAEKKGGERADDSDSDSEANFWPFQGAYEEDTNTYPYGTLSAVASHVTTQDATSRAAMELAGMHEGSSALFVDLGCGIGRVSNLVAATVRCPVLGIDVGTSSSKISFISNKGTTVEIVQNEIRQSGLSIP